MSCEGSQAAYWRVTAARPEVAAVFGSAQAAERALDELFSLARAQAAQASTLDRRSALAAEAATRALFAEMRDRHGLRPPAHSLSGLPKADAQQGYLVVYQTLQAIAHARALPPLAEQVRAAQRRGAATPLLAQVGNAPIAYNRDGYDAGGFNRDGYDDQGYDRSGRDRYGYDRRGYDRQGYNRHGYDDRGYDRSGFNPAGYDIYGLDAQGRTFQGYTLVGGTFFDAEGYDMDGYDRQGYDRQGYNRHGSDRQGAPHPFFVPDAQGLHPDGKDSAGYGPDGYREDGFDRCGFDRNGYNKWGYDRNGYDRNGRYTRAGRPGEYDSAGFRPDPVTRVGRDRLGFDNQGQDGSGYRISGYTAKGLDRNGMARTTTPHPKNGKRVEAKYNRSGWDQSGYDRTGFHRLTGLTEPDSNGQRRNMWGWVYDAATNEVVNPANPSERVTHVSPGFYRYDKCVPYRAYIPPPPPPPITPHTPMTAAEFRATLPVHVSQSEAEALFAARRAPTVALRWSTERARYDAKATRNGVLLRCPHCGRFTDGEAHSCPSFGPPFEQVLVYASGVVFSTSGYYGIVTTPHNPAYDPLYDTTGGYHWQTGFDRQGRDREGYTRDGRDRDGYTREGYDLFGYDRGGYDRGGYNKERRDRAGTLRPRTVADAAKALDDGSDPLNNEHLATLYSRIASSLRGQRRTVVFREGAGFATDMQGTIYADPYPLGRNAPDAHNLVVLKGGIYHEIAHEQFTPPDVWAAVLAIAQSPTPVAGLDAGRGLLPTIYNIIEDGGIERALSARYAGVAEVLAASCALDPRWGEQVGPQVGVGNEVMGALLYTALPYYAVSDTVRAQMTPAARTLLAELEPLVAAAVRGTPDDRFQAALRVACRFEEEGLLGPPPDTLQATPPPPPPPGTQPRSPQQGQQGGQKGQGSQQGQGGQEGQRGQQRGQQQGEQGGQGSQQGEQGDQQKGQRGSGGSGGRGAAADEQQRGGPRGGGASAPDEPSGPGRQRGSGQDDEQPGPGRPPAAPDEPSGPGRQRGSGQDDEQPAPGRSPAAPDEPSGPGRQRGSGQDDEQPGPGRPPAAPDEPSGPGRQRGSGQDDEQPGPGRPPAAPDEPSGPGQQRGSGQDDEQPGPGRSPAAPDEPSGPGRQRGGQDDPQGGEQGSDDQDNEGDQPARAGRSGQQGQGDQPAQGGSGGQRGEGDEGDQRADEPQEQASSSEGSTSGSGGAVGGSGSLRDVERSFSDADIAAIIAATEREAASAIDAGVRQAASVAGMGALLHRPLGNAETATQRFRAPDGRARSVPVALPRSNNESLLASLAARRPIHGKIASDLARQLQAVRDETDTIIRFQQEGSLDRRRTVAALKGAKDVKKQRQPVPETRFAASISVDLSGSMHHQISSGNLYDATMVLGDTFERLGIAYEVRGIGTDSSAFKSMDEPRFAPERAAQLAERGRGGTLMADTSGLASTALRACEEANKLLIALTDGAAGDHEATCKVLAEARRQGVVTFGLYLGTEPPTQQLDQLYGQGNWVPINDLKEMPTAIGKRLVSIFKRLQSRRA